MRGVTVCKVFLTLTVIIRYTGKVRIRLVLSSNYPILGKDTIVKALEAEIGVEAFHARIGDLIKEDCVLILDMLNNGHSVEEIATKFGANTEKLAYSLSEITEADLEANDPYQKTTGQRLLQQQLGLALYPDDYWLERLSERITSKNDHPFIASAGVRLVPEANTFSNLGFMHVRLVGKKDTAIQRSMSRDGRILTDKELNHPVERALDNYDKFDVTINAEDSLEDKLAAIIPELKKRHMLS